MMRRAEANVMGIVWARKAASANPPLPKAMFAMGYFTEVGIGCPRSLEEAKRWYARAACELFPIHDLFLLLVNIYLHTNTNPAYRFPKAQERLDELRKGGVNALQSSTSSAAGRPGVAGGGGSAPQVGSHRDKLTRKDHKKDESECAVM
jgi:TPR repeat protein